MYKYFSQISHFIYQTKQYTQKKHREERVSKLAKSQKLMNFYLFWYFVSKYWNGIIYMLVKLKFRSHVQQRNLKFRVTILGQRVCKQTSLLHCSKVWHVHTSHLIYWRQLGLQKKKILIENNLYKKKKKRKWITNNS